MQRLIKFRAWDTEKVEMDWHAHNRAYFGPLATGHLGFKNKTLMQYTGLKDKNGVEIYEGDLLSFGPDSHAHAVVWNLDRALFEISDWPIYESVYAAEVIGNIYENPELLESK